ncbi:MAG: type II toxin-antitoxin system HicA family toxin [Planctomycetes bacterium]|nr:type II toxin-antitoxin system HicA family toxin [Planctomycetota bacterium]MBU4398369.1 type II toxin-antitoxin system HicA family toxin [Planctomycetota bacterium]
MGRLAGISGRAAAAAFVRAGYHVVRQKGSHVILGKRGRPNLVIPMHRSVAPFLLRSQIRRAGLTEDRFLDLL